MKYEKSCGAVIFRNGDNGREYLLVMNKKGTAPGRWGFPKGHTEAGENDYLTAVREVYEETGVMVVIYAGAKVTTHYSPREGVEKDVVYFLATPRNNAKVTIQQSEICAYKWVGAKEARTLLNFDVGVLDKMERFF